MYSVEDVEAIYRQNTQSYDRFAVHYADHHASLNEIGDLLSKFAGMVAGGSSILDVGCGHGRDAAYFEAVGHNVVGLDTSRKLLEIAKRRVPEADFVQADARAIPFGYSIFDGVWINAVLHHLVPEDMVRVLQECRRVMKASSPIYVSVHLEKQAGWRRKYQDFVRYYSETSESSMRDYLCCAGFSDISMSTRVGNDRWLHFFAHSRARSLGE